MSHKPLEHAVAALLVACGIALNPVSAFAATTVIDFSNGLPAGGTDSGGTVIVDGYKFTSGVTVASLGSGLGTALTVIDPNTLYPGTSVTVSRVDHATFDLQEFNAIVSVGAGGLSNFNLTPFDSNGNELNPVTFYGAYPTDYIKTGTVSGQDVFTTNNIWVYPNTAQGPFSGLSQLKFSLGGTSNSTYAYSKFTFDSATAPVPEPATYTMLLAGMNLVGFMAYRRKNDSSRMLMPA